MAEELTHRLVAAAAFNKSWELLERERDEVENLELLEVAFTSRHHWRAEGGQQQIAVSDWMIARCFAELGEGRLSLRFANSALAAEPADAPAWLSASLLEGLARAYAAIGDADARDRTLARARTTLEAEGDQEDRALIESQLASVPPASTALPR